MEAINSLKLVDDESVQCEGKLTLKDDGRLLSPWGITSHQETMVLLGSYVCFLTAVGSLLSTDPGARILLTDHVHFEERCFIEKLETKFSFESRSYEGYQPAYYYS